MRGSAAFSADAKPPTTEEGEVAERKRPGPDAEDDRPDDEVFAEAIDDVDADEPVSRGGGTAIRERVRADADQEPRAKKDGEPGGRVGRFLGGAVFSRIARFLREVVAELRKVIWPTRKELLTYTAVVVVFLVAMTAIVVGFDQAFAWLVLRVFGN
jgi:preprotein translocase subunit SecE